MKGFQDYLAKNKTEAEELVSIAAKIATETRDDFWEAYNNQVKVALFVLMEIV